MDTIYTKKRTGRNRTVFPGGKDRRYAVHFRSDRH